MSDAYTPVTCVYNLLLLLRLHFAAINLEGLDGNKNQVAEAVEFGNRLSATAGCVNIAGGGTLRFELAIGIHTCAAQVKTKA